MERNLKDPEQRVIPFAPDLILWPLVISHGKADGHWLTVPLKKCCTRDLLLTTFNFCNILSGVMTC